MRIFIVGHKHQNEDIRNLAFKVREMFPTWYVVFEQRDNTTKKTSLMKRIQNSLSFIKVSDFIFVMQKPDGTVSKAMMYKIAYSSDQNKRVFYFHPDTSIERLAELRPSLIGMERSEVVRLDI